MIIAPSFARAPYNAVAAAPLRIVIDSISSGLKSPILFPKSTLLAVVPPGEVASLTVSPSITYKGKPPSNEFTPRITTLVDPPIVPDWEFTLTPAALPAKEFKTFEDLAFVNSSDFIVEAL
ncbi:hypothetical protein D3C79_864820 [compost metagenome]